MAVNKYSYGFVESFLKAYPEINTLVATAVKKGMEPEAFQIALKNTKWYRARSEAQRAFDTVKYNDPTEYKRRVALRQQQATALAAQLGVQVSPATMTKWVESWERNQSGEEEMRLLLGTTGALDINKATGLASTTVDSLRALASDYGVPASDETLVRQTRDVLAGKGTAQGMSDYYREQAKKQYASIAGELDAGMTVRQVAQPYLDMASEELGVSADTMDLRDSKWTTMFQGDKAMTYDQFRATVRQDERYGWINGVKAKQQAASMIGEIAKRFGAQ